jgi:pimeloyl-ACP methyl ester carboxylesterase
MALKAYASGTLFAEVSWTAPRILALHGWGRRAADFGPALKGLSYLAPDLPGFGASPPPTQAFGSRQYATAVEPLLDELAARAVLVGHSFGGRVALHLADRYHARFAGLILTGAPLVRLAAARKPHPIFRLGRWAGNRGFIPAARVERLRERYGSSDYRAAKGVMRDVLVRTINESYESELANLSLPVVLVWGADDREVPLSVAEGLTARISSAELQVLSGVGHAVPMEAPQALREAVEKMLTR